MDDDEELEALLTLATSSGVLSQHQAEKIRQLLLHPSDFLFPPDKKEVIMDAVGLSEGDYQIVKGMAKQMMMPKVLYGSQVQVRRSDPMSTGIEGLDTLLGGGLCGGEILEVYGPTGSGKTQLCQAITAHFLKNLNFSVTYFDLKSSIFVKRVLHLCEGEREALKNLRILRPSSFPTFLNDLKEIQRKILEGDDDAFKRLKLVIIDPLPSIFYTVVEENCLESWRFYQEQVMNELQKITNYNDGIVFVIVNHAVSTQRRPTASETSNNASSSKKVVDETVCKPALGHMYWGHKPNFRLKLKKLPEEEGQENVVEALLVKSSRTESGKGCNFTLDLNTLYV